MTSNIVTVDFRDDTLFAVERDDGVFVAVKPIADSLGLGWASQRQRIYGDPVLSEGVTTIVMPSPGGAQEMVCLRLDLMNGWLFKVDSRRVGSDDTRKKLIEYQRDCYAVLFRHFYGKAAGPHINADEEAETSEGSRLRMVTETRHTFGVRSAAELWFKLGLPVVPSMLHDPRQAEMFDSGRIRSAADQNEEAA